MWYHYFCENLTHKEFRYHGDNPSATFECSICLSVRCEDNAVGLPESASCSGNMREILADSGECENTDRDQMNSNREVGGGGGGGAGGAKFCGSWGRW